MIIHNCPKCLVQTEIENDPTLLFDLTTLTPQSREYCIIETLKSCAENNIFNFSLGMIAVRCPDCGFSSLLKDGMVIDGEYIDLYSRYKYHGQHHTKNAIVKNKQRSTADWKKLADKL